MRTINRRVANISARCSRRFLRDAVWNAYSPASDRIFDIVSFSPIFVPFSLFFFFLFFAIVRARSRVETAAENCYSRGRLLSRRAFARGSWELFLCGPQDAKMMFAPIWELRASFVERVIASLLGTLAWPDPRLFYIFAIFRFNFSCPRCE